MAEPLLGYALSFKNRALNADLFGSPHAVLDSVQARGLAPASLAEHPRVKMGDVEVFKGQPERTFSGGRHAESPLDFLPVLRAPQRACVHQQASGGRQFMAVLPTGA
jgi:hypothetical protein